MGLSRVLRALIQEIEELYNKVALTLLHKRMSGYHRHMSHKLKPHARDIKSPLLDCIDNVIVREGANSTFEPPHDIGSAVLGDAETGSKTALAPEQPDARSPFAIDRKRVGELSNYFKKRKKGAELHPGIKDKLKHSVWEHINASMTCARRGDKRNAKMHVDIANTAFKEVAHYMPEDQYSELRKKINERLEVLKKQ